MSTEQVSSATVQEWRPRANPWWICAAVMLATIIEVLDTTIASVSVPNIAGNLGVTNHEGTWVITSYLVANAILLPATAWLGSFFGRKRLLLICIFIFTLASVMCGLANSFGFLLVARVLQGFGGAALPPLAQAILMESFPKEKRGMAMAVYITGLVMAPILGPILGGWLTDNFSWRWIFLINIPIGALALFMANVFVEDPPYLKKGNASSIDYVGFCLMALGLAVLEIILDKGQTEDWFQATWICWSAVTVVVSLTSFVIWELRQKHPVVDLRVFRDRNFFSGQIITFLLGAIMYGAITVIPLFFQTLMGYTAYLSGVAQLSLGLGMFLGSMVVGVLMGKVDGRLFLLAGLLLICAGCGWIAATINPGIGMEHIALPFCVLGMGICVAFVPLTTLALGMLRNEDMGNGSGIFNLMRNIGGSAGIALVTTVIARMGQVHQDSLVSHLTQYDPVYQEAIRTQGQNAYGSMYQELMRQAMMLSYIDVFIWIAILAACCMPFVLLFRKVSGAVMAH